jgi:hypothetical protein
LRFRREAARHAFGEIAPLHRDFPHLLAGIGGADLDLDALGGGFADEDAVVAPHVVDDRLVEAIAADAHASCEYTMPFSEITATSEVPPPMSRTMEPRASCTGRPAPTAAAIGS